jgi:hypothetical protein
MEREAGVRHRVLVLLFMVASMVVATSAPGVSSVRAVACAWKVLPGPAPGGEGSGIAAAGNQAWVVAAYTARPQVARWHRGAWTTRTIADPGFAGGDLRAIAAVSVSDVWAVGGHYTDADVYPPLAAHWDGATWTTVSPPYDRDGNAFFQAVSAPASDDVWAVGYESLGSSDEALVDHWDGTSWTQVPGPAGDVILIGVAAISPTNVWVISDTDTYQWNGTTWNSIAHAESTSGPFLQNISASSASDIWVVGLSPGVDGTPATFHWDGTSWTEVPAPTYGTGANALFASAGGSPRRAWAVGRWGYTSEFPLVLQWDGLAWTVVATASPRVKHQRLVAAALVPGTHTFWVLGAGGFVERFC